MPNAIENIVGLAIVSILVIAFTITWYIGDTITTNVKGNLTANNPTLSSEPAWISTEGMYSDAWDIISSAFIFMLYLTVALTLFSSFIQKNTLTSYASMFFLSLIASGICVFIVTEFYNSFILNSGAIDLTNFPYWWFDNIELIIIANAIAGAASFLFINKGRGE
jgi:hypothetical protein